MSGVLGVWNRDGVPVQRGLLERLAEPMAHRGPDGLGLWVDGPMGMGGLLMRVTPESASERQPLVGPSGSVLVWDGRLDNRSELLALLAGRGRSLPPGSPDPALVIAAYEEFGDAFVARLLGDFALAVYDPRIERSILVRDPLGVRPLSYWLTPSLLVFATEIKSLLAHPAVPTSPDEDTIAEMLLNGWPRPDGGETFFRGVRDVLPSHMVEVSASGTRTRRYWDFDPEARIRLKGSPEYAEAFRSVFETAVHRRMRAVGPIAVTVSGGLDSSSIAGLAMRIRRSHPELPEVFGLHRVAREGTAAYELDFVRDVQRLHGLEVELLPFEVGASSVAGAWITEVPDFDPFDRMLEAQAAILRRRGARVLLVGSFGDELLGDTLYLLDLARRLRWLAVRRHLTEITSWTRDAGEYYRMRFRTDLARRLVPRASLPALRRGKMLLRDPFHGQPWWGPTLRARARRSARVPPPPVRFRSESARSLYLTLRDKRSLLARQQWDKAAAFYGYEELSPYLDRDLASFLIAIPGEVLHRGGVHRGLLREAMRGDLPPSVVERVAKGEYGDLFNAGLAERSRATAIPTSEWEVVRRGYVVGEAVDRAMEERSAFAVTRLHSIRRVLELESWLRAYFGRSQAGAPGRSPAGRDASLPTS